MPVRSIVYNDAEGTGKGEIAALSRLLNIRMSCRNKADHHVIFFVASALVLNGRLTVAIMS